MIELSDHWVLDRMLEPVTDCLTPDVARRIADLRADPVLQARLDELASKSNNGDLSLDEQREYQAFVEALDLVGVLQSKARGRVALADKEGAGEHSRICAGNES